MPAGAAQVELISLSKTDWASPDTSGTQLENSGSGWSTSVPSGRDLVIGLTGNYTPPAGRPPASSGPNIIVILVDDMSWTDIASGKPNLNNGSTYHQTPHIDRLANEGVSFTSCYAHPNCAPTRAALLSGQYPARSGNGVYNVTSLNRGSGGEAFTVPSQNEDVPAAHYTMAEMLWDAGYVTCHVGKYHVGNHEGGAETQPENQGFDYNYGGTDGGAPGSFFASYNTSEDWHFDRPWPTIDPFADRYTSSYITSFLAPFANGNNPATLDGSNKHLVDAEADAAIEFLDNHLSGPLSDYPFYLQYHTYSVHTPIQLRPDLQTKYQGISSTDPRHDSAGYAGHLEGLDQAIGRLLDHLDTNNLANDTLVIFFSDNGGAEPYTYDPNPGDDGIAGLTQPWELYNLTDDISETTNLIGDGNYWNDLLYGPVADEMAADLGAWLTQSDPTWNAVQVKDGGIPVAYPPTDVPNVTVPYEQTLRLLEVETGAVSGEVALTFRSAAGYNYDIQVSGDLWTWTTIASDIAGQAGSTMVSKIPDPPSATDDRRFYRALLRP